MTGKEKIEAALSAEGTPEIPAVICYEGIYIRDHWPQLTGCPWWYQHSPDIERQLEWHRDVIDRTDQDWVALPGFYSRESRQHIRIEPRADGVYSIDTRTGEAYRLTEPQISGWSPGSENASIHPDTLALTPDELDVHIPVSENDDPSESVRGGGDLVKALMDEYGHLFPISSVGSPLWGCYGLWGFEGMMTLIASRPDLVEYACGRFLRQVRQTVRRAAAMGARGIWIEECLTDMISPEAFRRLNVPCVRAITEEIRAAGMKSVYYYCGDPAGKWEMLLDVGADALSLEESKKGFRIDIEEVAERAGGRCAILGNLDAIGALQEGSESDLKAEISRQIAAGRRNGSRFIMSLGSPVTPETPADRVRLYCDLTHELGGAV
ncbi:MAG: hypothetical protein IT210_09805 [Armatimonadetes bacterium]|nr:hypothetical protein [Armatimonadota bacterium]